MSMVELVCIGGSRDGERVRVHHTQSSLKIPMRVPMPAAPEGDPTELREFRYETYHVEHFHIPGSPPGILYAYLREKTLPHHEAFLQLINGYRGKR